MPVQIKLFVKYLELGGIGFLVLPSFPGKKSKVKIKVVHKVKKKRDPTGFFT